MASHVHPADPAGGQWALALFLLTLLESDGRDGRDRRDSPDVVIYSSVISACEKGRQWQRALQVLWRMEVLQIRPNHGGVFVGRFSEGACSAMQKKHDVPFDMFQRNSKSNGDNAGRLYSVKHSSVLWLLPDSK